VRKSEEHFENKLSKECFLISELYICFYSPFSSNSHVEDKNAFQHKQNSIENSRRIIFLIIFIVELGKNEAISLVKRAKTSIDVTVLRKERFLGFVHRDEK